MNIRAVPPSRAPADDSLGSAVLMRLDNALGPILQEEEYVRVRPGPWWALERHGEGPGVGWKRAFLERVPGAGAVHWGHWFFLHSPQKIALTVSGSGEADPEESSMIEIPVAALAPSGTARFLVREIAGRGRLVVLARRAVEVATGGTSDGATQ